MVRGIFIHDLPIYKDINGKYCSTTLTDDVFKRYLKVVDELVVATRVFPLNCSYEEAHQEMITLPNIRFLDIPNLNSPKYVIRIPKARKEILNEIKNSDLIFIRGGIIGLIGAKIARRLKKPYLDECGGRAWDEYWNYSILGKLMAPYMEFNARLTVREAKYTVYVTEKWLQNKYPTKGKEASVSDVVINDMNEDLLVERHKKMKNKDNSYEWVVGTAGGLNSKIKGHRFVIEAIAGLPEDFPIRYEIVGSGKQDYLRTLAKKLNIENKIVFKGELNHQEVLAWMDNIDIYIQPSLQEGLPRALVEAMSRGCPCLGSTAGGIPELLEKEFVFNKGNTDEIRDKLERLSDTDWISQSRRNFEKAKEFQFNKLDEKRENFFNEYRDYVLREIR